jgi:hypothetical protein
MADQDSKKIEHMVSSPLPFTISFSLLNRRNHPPFSKRRGKNKPNKNQNAIADT